MLSGAITLRRRQEIETSGPPRSPRPRRVPRRKYFGTLELPLPSLPTKDYQPPE
jgi:hypothetical protein